jgi:hypothetical protein
VKRRGSEFVITTIMLNNHGKYMDTVNLKILEEVCEKTKTKQKNV